MARVDDVLARCDRLGALPGAVVRVASMLSSGDFQPVEVEKILRTDEALSAAVLRLVNSATYGVQGRVLTLKEGIVRLGSKTLLKLVLDHQAGAVFSQDAAAYGVSRRGLWRGAVGGAIAAEILVKKHAGCDPGVAYVAALLRDVGKLAIAHALGPDALASATHESAGHDGFVHAERLALGLDHAQLGAELARRWGLPQPIVDAIAHHHAPPAPGEPGASRLNDVVHAADVIALWAGLGLGNDGLCYRLAPHVEAELGITRREVESEITQTWCAVEDLELALASPNERGAA